LENPDYIEWFVRGETEIFSFSFLETTYPDLEINNTHIDKDGKKKKNIKT